MYKKADLLTKTIKHSGQRSEKVILWLVFNSVGLDLKSLRYPLRFYSSVRCVQAVRCRAVGNEQKKL